MDDLFTIAERRARASDPETSHAAARMVTFDHAHYGAILGALSWGEATIYDIAIRSGLTHVQVARRLPEMQEKRLVCPTGETAVGPTGRQCRVWRRS